MLNPISQSQDDSSHSPTSAQAQAASVCSSSISLPTLDGLEACIHCGMCLPVCPTYLATGSEAESPRGRLYLMKKWIDGELSTEAVQPHLDQCLACHGCETACPSGVQYGHLLMETRAAMAPGRRTFARILKRFVFRWILPNDFALIVGGFLLYLYQHSGLQGLLRLSGLLKIIPSLAIQEALLPEIPAHRALQSGDCFGELDGIPVTLLVGCVMDVFYNPIHWDTISVLVANGYRVRIPERTCCGALAHHAGEMDITERLAWQTIEALLDNQPEWIVINSAGCGSSIKDYSHFLKPETPEQAHKLRELGQKVVDISELLAKKPLAPFVREVPLKVAYHAACHLYHVQKVQSQPLALLAQVPGLQLVPLENADLCCGSAGIYNLEQPGLSEEILAAKMESVRTACAVGQADTLTTGNPGCLLQLSHGVKQAGLRLAVRHPISLLAQGYSTIGK
jgi:glycolate oxidase iron-sulfur subunit